jgi:hypothetical protein
VFPRVNEELKSCANCGIKMSRKRFNGRLEDLSAWKRRRFCSLSCANTRKEVGYHGNSWRARKHLKKLCEHCRKKRNLHAHHLNKDRTDNSKQNISTLCGRCHALAHHGKLVSQGQRSKSLRVWTELDASAMQSFRKSRSSSVRSSR